MGTHLERPAAAPPTLRQLWADLGPRYAANGFIGWLFAATAPVAIILSVGTQGGLTEAQLASWLFGAFFVNGLITILFCWLYRQPLAFFFGINRAAPAPRHLAPADRVGAKPAARPARPIDDGPARVAAPDCKAAVEPRQSLDPRGRARSTRPGDARPCHGRIR